MKKGGLFAFNSMQVLDMVCNFLLVWLFKDSVVLNIVNKVVQVMDSTRVEIFSFTIAL